MPMPNNEGKQKYIVTVTVQCGVGGGIKDHLQI